MYIAEILFKKRTSPKLLLFPETVISNYPIITHSLFTKLKHSRRTNLYAKHKRRKRVLLKLQQGIVADAKNSEDDVRIRRKRQERMKKKKKIRDAGARRIREKEGEVPQKAKYSR